MVRKKTEGNEDQRRAAARQARAAGTSPSALKETTGASKQRTHLSRKELHEEKAATAHEGKQQWLAREPGAAVTSVDLGLNRTFDGEREDYTAEHERVFLALTEIQAANGGEGAYLDEIARACGLPQDRVRSLLHDLTTVHRLATELGGIDTPDLGPRFEEKPRL
jgi:small-conductance mechanosensitive channel